MAGNANAPEKVAGFEPIDLPLPKLGIDVVTPEGDLAEGAVRKADNVMLHDSGAFDRRPGFAALVSLAGAHSLWKGANGAFVAANGVLYAFPSMAALYSGLTEDPVAYTEVGQDVYFTSGETLRKITGGVVRKPGVANIIGDAPTLAATDGSMRLASYGVAYSLVNDLGEESGLSDARFITATGILLTGIANADNVAKVNVYATAANGEVLYLHKSVPWSASASVLDHVRTKEADKQHLVPMPGGEHICHYRGRLYVSKDVWIYYSEPFMGLTSIYGGYLTFGAPVTMLAAVESGIFVGTAERVFFLRGTGPKAFEPVPTLSRGAVSMGSNAPADQFPGEGTGTVAYWLSPQGLVIGRPDGSVSLPQSDRIRLASSGGRGAVLHIQGIRQAVFAQDDLTLGVGSAEDSTGLAIVASGKGFAAGTSAATA